jgi:hypothetical protein
MVERGATVAAALIGAMAMAATTRVVDPEIEVDPAFFQGGFDQTKRWGPAQEAPLTPECQKVLEDSMRDHCQRRAWELSELAMPAERHAAHDDLLDP